MAIAAMILGIWSCSWSLIPIYNLIFALVPGILGLVFGSKALRDSEHPNWYGMAKAGKICGLIGVIVTGAISLILIIACVACATNGGFDYLDSLSSSGYGYDFY